jgi:hypothetical protein
MAAIVENKNLSLGQAKKKIWTEPSLQTITINAALGSKAGSKCDKFGSLSVGSGCP